jgi:hypothetical protein
VGACCVLAFGLEWAGWERRGGRGVK